MDLDVYKQLNHIFFEEYQKEIGDFGSDTYKNNIKSLISENIINYKMANEALLLEIFRHASDEKLVSILSSLNNEKLSSIIGLMSLGDIEIILSKIKDETQINRFLKIYEKILGHNGFDTPAFFRKNVKSNIFNKNKFFNHEDEYENILNKKIEEIKFQYEKKLNICQETSYKERESIKNEYEKKIAELELQFSELIQKRIDENLSRYVNSAVDELNLIQKDLNFSAGLWSFFAGLMLLITLILGVAYTLFGTYFGPNLSDLNWPELLIISFKGVFVISAVAAVITFCFRKSNFYTHEAIIISNRAHAIKFGKLYLEIYGNTVERSEMVKIFENWNISSDTAFIQRNKNDSHVDFEKYIKYMKEIKDLAPSLNK